VLHGNSWFADVTAATKTRVKALAWQYQVALLSLIKAAKSLPPLCHPGVSFFFYNRSFLDINQAES
jgi:hypothetical protein